MNLSMLLKLLFPFCAANENEADFIISTTTNIMESSDNVEHPLTKLTPDYRKRIFEGTKSISRKSATAILKRLDKMRFEEYLSNLSSGALNSIADLLNCYGFDANLGNVTIQCASIFESVLRNIASGVRQTQNEQEIFVATPLNNLPHRRNPYFTGREEKLKTIHNNFKSKEIVSVTQSVTGLVGVGKTSVALEYAYSHFDKYETIWWINAETEQMALDFFRNFGLKKKIITVDSQAGEIIEAVKNWLNNVNNKDWIFIYDNADAAEFNLWFEKYLPQTSTGHVLITTRSHSFPQSVAVNIDIFSIAEAVSFLKKRTKKSGQGYSDDLAKILAERLQCLPLALEQAAAYIEQTPDVTYQDYIDLVERHGVGVFENDNYIVDYTSTVAVTWKISMEKITEFSAVQMFNMCAFFTPSKIPVDIFVKGSAALPSALKEAIADDLRRNDIIRDLRRYSLLSCENDREISSAENRVLYMHRLLQEVAQESLKESSEWLEYSLSLLYVATDWSKGDKDSISTFRAESPHVISVIEKSADVFADEVNLRKIALLCNSSSLAYSDLGNYIQAIGYGKKALTINKKVHGEEHFETATAYNNLGKAYGIQCDYQKSLKYYNKALEIYVKVCGKEHPDTAHAYNNIGYAYDNLGKYSESLTNYKTALAIREKFHGEEHPDTASSYNNIGMVYQVLGSYGQALEYFNKALKAYEKTFGNEHPNTATALNNLGYFYKVTGDYAESLKYYHDALAIYQEVYGEEHPETANSHNNIGLVYDVLGEYQKAFENHNKALELREKIYGSRHPDTAHSINNLGLIYTKLGDYVKALQYFNSSLAVLEENYDKEHPLIATTYNNMGYIYRATGEHKKSLENYSKSLAIRMGIYGEEHPDTASSYNNLGYVYDSLGNHEKSLDYYRKGLKIREKFYGEEHPDMANSYNNVGYAYGAVGDYPKALEFLGKALDIRIRAYGEGHPDTANSLNNIGGIYDMSGDYKQALGYFKKAYVVYENVYGKEHPSTVTVKRNIVKILLIMKEGQYEETCGEN